MLLARKPQQEFVIEARWFPVGAREPCRGTGTDERDELTRLLRRGRWRRRRALACSEQNQCAGNQRTTWESCAAALCSAGRIAHELARIIASTPRAAGNAIGARIMNTLAAGRPALQGRETGQGVGRGACRGREENSVGAASLKKKKERSGES